MFDPKSIAIYGASPTPTGAGARAQAQLKLMGFGGPTYLINRKYEAIGELPCHPSAEALPEPVDAVLVTVPRAAVLSAVEDCVRAGAKAVILFAAGFAEVGGGGGAEEQARLGAVARESGVRIIGPNCLGAVNYVTGAALTYTNIPVAAPEFAGLLRHDRALGVVSQSGGLGFAAVQAAQRGVVFSHLLTSGNSCDVDVADLIAYLAEEPRCHAIACVLESMPEPTRMLEAAALASAADKPIVVHKLGTGQAGAEAVLSHSGSLAGSHEAYLAAFREAGMIVVDRFEHLIETASAFAKLPRAGGTGGVAVLTSSGGASVMAADKAEIHGVPLPQPSAATRELLTAKLPDFGTARNPCDVTGGVANDAETFFACVEALLEDPVYEMMVTAHPYSVHTAKRVASFGSLAARYGKPVHNVWITEFLAGPGFFEAEADPNLTVFRSMDRCFATLAAWYRRQALRAADDPRRDRSESTPEDLLLETARRLRAAEGTALGERDAKRLLAAYGIPVVDEAAVSSADAAVEAAQRIGFPVVLKLDAPDLLHKTEFGAVRLDLASEAAVRDAAEALLAAGRRLPTPSRGLLVQPMVGQGVELIVGARIDPLFGPLVLVGMGGVMAELLKDSQVELAPISPSRARAMLGRLRGAALFEGFRGSAPIDLAALATLVSRVSQFAADHRDLIAELDLNPVICSAQRVIAVDALIVLAGRGPEGGR